jgi:uncharacterized cupredoxin-like copper-binding protein
MKIPGLPLLLALALAPVTPAWSHDDQAMHEPTAAREQKPWGSAGNAKGARTLQVAMGDAMRFSPDRIEVHQGETVRLVLRNTGAVVHEMVIGTPKELREHAAMMKDMPGMEHAEPSMARVPPGQSGEIVWSFNRPGTFEFACLVPGHYEAGMKGTIVVIPTAANQR